MGRAAGRRHGLRTRTRRKGMPAPGAWGIVQRIGRLPAPPPPLDGSHSTSYLSGNLSVSAVSVIAYLGNGPGIAPVLPVALWSLHRGLHPYNWRHMARARAR